MVDYFSTHLHAFWFTVGFVLLAIELLVLNFSSGFVLFLGLGALLTGGLLWGQVVPLSWLSSIATFTIGSSVITGLLWKPFKALQAKGGLKGKDNTSDFINYEFRLESDISHTQPGKTRYSGIEWSVILDKYVETSVEKGTLVKVVSIDAGKFYVQPVVK